MCAKEISEIFNNYAVGFGALSAGVGGFIVFWNWAEVRNNKTKFKKIKDIYHPSKLKKTDTDGGSFKLFRFPNNFGRIYIYDLSDQKRHWIKDGGTYVELGYERNVFSDVTEDSIDEEYKKYKDGDDIIAP